MREILFIIIAMAAIFVQALVGFGGTLLAMPLGIMAIGMATAKPTMTVVAWIAGITITIMDFRYINRKELAKMVSVMLLGVLAGLWLTGKVKLQWLLLFYAVVVIAIGLKKLFLSQKKEMRPAVRNTALAIAGLMQGLFVSGGSFLAVYAVSGFSEKREFRATVNAVWAIINTVMIATYCFTDTMTKSVLTLSAWSLMPTLAAIWLGALLAEKVPQKMFLKIIYIILIASGTVLLITNL